MKDHEPTLWSGKVCDDPGHAFSYIDWVFTMRPGVFGLIGGLANPTGVALIIIDTFMTVGSLPAIRKSRFVRVYHSTGRPPNKVITSVTASYR